MKNTGKFIAKVTVSGKSRDERGNIISHDKNGLPAIWLNVMAGTIPNRQTITGSVAQRMGIPMDSNGIIEVGATAGNPSSFRIIYGSWLHTSDNDDFGPQYAWDVLKDLTNASVKEVEETCQLIGEPSVFIVERPELPKNYTHKVVHHEGQAKQDSKVHSLYEEEEEAKESIHRPAKK